MTSNNILFFNTESIINNLDRVTNFINDYLLSKQIEERDINIIFVNADEIKRLNQKYRNKNKITDVITFSMIEGEDVEFSGNMLGDVYICSECIENRSYEEIIRRIFHGVIHLSGVDHEGSTKKYDVFLEIENNLMTQFFGV